MALKAILVDDEDMALRLFEVTIKKCEKVEYIGGFSSCKTALKFAESNKIDIAFLDIEMQEMLGLELAEKLRKINKKINIVFVTGYERYAFQAFGVNAVGYLLKPYSIIDLNKIIDKIFETMSSENRVKIVTMPRFDIFVDGRLVQFERAKSKEYLALLVDRLGGEVTSDYIATYLYENRAYDENTKTMCRVALSSLIKTLKEYDCAEIIQNKKNSHCINGLLVDCDVDNLFKNDKNVASQYNGQYMFDYSWSENTNRKIAKFLNYNQKDKM